MKFFVKIPLYFIILIAVIMGLVVILNFFNTIIFHYKDFQNVKGLANFGVIGDFFSGHINGFILLTLIISLYFQRTSIKQTWKSIEQQAEANKTISEDLQNSINANTQLTKEFITTNYKNEFNEELRHIKILMVELDIKKLCDYDFKVIHILNNESLIELLKRKNYLNSLLVNIEDDELKNSLIHKIDTANINIYINKNEELLKKVFVFNELLKVFKAYESYLVNNKKIEDIEETKDLKNIYEFLMDTIDRKHLVEQNRFELFESIASSNKLFEKDFNLIFNAQLLWKTIFEKDFYMLNGYYNVLIQDYELDV